MPLGRRRSWRASVVEDVSEWVVHAPVPWWKNIGELGRKKWNPYRKRERASPPAKHVPHGWLKAGLEPSVVGGTESPVPAVRAVPRSDRVRRCAALAIPLRAGAVRSSWATPLDPWNLPAWAATVEDPCPQDAAARPRVLEIPSVAGARGASAMLDGDAPFLSHASESGSDGPDRTAAAMVPWFRGRAAADAGRRPATSVGRVGRCFLSSPRYGGLFSPVRGRGKRAGLEGFSGEWKTRT